LRRSGGAGSRKQPGLLPETSGHLIASKSFQQAAGLAFSILFRNFLRVGQTDSKVALCLAALHQRQRVARLPTAGEESFSLASARSTDRFLPHGNKFSEFERDNLQVGHCSCGDGQRRQETRCFQCRFPCRRTGHELLRDYQYIPRTHLRVQHSAGEQV